MAFYGSIMGNFPLYRQGGRTDSPSLPPHSTPSLNFTAWNIFSDITVEWKWTCNLTAILMGPKITFEQKWTFLYSFILVFSNENSPCCLVGLIPSLLAKPGLRECLCPDFSHSPSSFVSRTLWAEKHCLFGRIPSLCGVSHALQSTVFLIPSEALISIMGSWTDTPKPKWIHVLRGDIKVL